MRLIIAFMLILITPLASSAQIKIPNFTYSHGEVFFSGLDGQIYLINSYDKEYICLTQMIEIDLDGYIRIQYQLSEEYYPILENGTKYIIIPGSDHVFLLTDSKRIDQTFRPNESTFIASIEANKYLLETLNGRIIEYKPDNLLTRFFATDKEFRYELLPSGIPWAISKNDISVAELSISFTGPVEGIVLLNGFVDLKRTKLFYENSRIKSIEVEDVYTKKRVIVQLEDGVVFHDISFPFTTDKIIIRIKDVYCGSRFTDVCISAILPFFNDEMIRKANIFVVKDDYVSSGSFLKEYSEIEF